MTTQRRGYSIVPAVLGAALLALLVAAGLSPNTGAVAASSNCGIYNNCPSSGPAFPWWVVAVVVLIVAIALIAALVLMRRRRPPAAAAPMQAWKDTGPVPPPGASPPPGAGASPAYLETPEDVGHAPPEGATAGAAAAGAGAAGAAGAAAEGEPDIDSLMAELDKISGEILKRAPKKSPDDEDAEGAGDPGTQ